MNEPSKACHCYTSGAVPKDCFFESKAYEGARRRLFGENPMNTAILGEVRAGKSSCLDALARHARDHHSDHFDVARVGLTETKVDFGCSGGSLLKGIARAIAAAWGSADDAQSQLEQRLEAATSVSEIKRALSEVAESRLQARKRYTLVVIDDYDQVMGFGLNCDDFILLRDLLERPFQHGLVSVIAARRNLLEIEEVCGSVGSKFWSLYGSPPTRLSLLDQDETKRFVGRFAPAGCAEDPHWVEALADLVGRHPATLMLALDAIAAAGGIVSVNDLQPSSVGRSDSGALRTLRDGQRDLYAQWKMRLGEKGPHGDLWSTLRRLSMSIATEDDREDLEQLLHWGHIEYDRGKDLESADYAWGYRPFCSLFDNYLQEQPSGNLSLFQHLANVETGLRRICVRTIESLGDGEVDAWMRVKHPKLFTRLTDKTRSAADHITVPVHGLLDYAYLVELKEIFLDPGLWQCYPQSVRATGSQTEWRRDLDRLAIVRNPVAHFRVLTSSAAAVLQDICTRRAKQLDDGLSELSGRAAPS